MTLCQPNFKRIAQRIRERRRAKNMTQEKLAEHIDVSAKFICFVETERKNVSLTSLYKIAEALETTLDYFVY